MPIVIASYDMSIDDARYDEVTAALNELGGHNPMGSFWIFPEGVTPLDVTGLLEEILGEDHPYFVSYAQAPGRFRLETPLEGDLTYLLVPQDEEPG